MMNSKTVHVKGNNFHCSIYMRAGGEVQECKYPHYVGRRGGAVKVGAEGYDGTSMGRVLV